VATGNSLWQANQGSPAVLRCRASAERLAIERAEDEGWSVPDPQPPADEKQAAGRADDRAKR